MRKTKIFFAFITVLAALTATASMANAAGKFNSEKGGTAEGKNHVFEAHGVPVTCEVAKFVWTETGKLTSLMVVPKYEKCKLLGATAKVEMNTCEYIFLISEITANKLYKGKGEVHVSGGLPVLTACEIKIEVSVIGCKLIVPDQKGLSFAEYNNLNETAGAFEGEIVSHVEGIAYTSKGCTGIPAAGADGKYKGTVIEKGVIVEP